MDKIEERDLKILRHIGHFGVSTPKVIQSLFFGGTVSAYSPVMDRLRNKLGLVHSHRVLKHSRSYYQLTHAGASLLGLPESRARPLQRQALLTHLAILWFCTMNGRNRVYVADKAAIAAYLGGTEPLGYHCLQPANSLPAQASAAAQNVGTNRIYHLYVPMPDTGRRNLFKSIVQHYLLAAADPALAQAIAHREYAFAIIVNTPTKAEVVKLFLHGKLRPDIPNRRRRGRANSKTPLAADAHFCVECVPDFEKGEARGVHGTSPQEIAEQNNTSEQHDGRMA